MATTATRTNGNGKVDDEGTALGTALNNDGEFAVLATAPYVATVTIEGTSPILFHRWSCEDVAAKASAAKNSAAKKTDNVESYVYRCEDGTIGIPGMYLRGAIVGAARYKQDPRSPRKSAMDLYKAGVVPLTLLASLGKAEWDYLDQQRVTVQRSGVTRVRPAFLAGWKATFDLQVLTPEYIAPADLLHAITEAGRLIGIADFRPTYGRFQVTSFHTDAS